MKEVALARPRMRVFPEIIKEKALPVPNVKGELKIKDKPGALTAVRQVRIPSRELKKCRKLARSPVERSRCAAASLRLVSSR